MPTTYYLHTLNGQPAFFDGDQVVFACFYGKAAPLAASRRQIAKEQRKSRAYRAALHLEDGDRYGYRRVAAPEERA